VWVIVLPLAASPLVYFAGRLSRPALSRWLCVLVLAAAWIPFIQTVPTLGESGAESYRLGAITLQWDGLAQLMAALVLGLSALAAIFSTADIAGEAGEEKYFALLLTMVGVLIGLACSTDLFNLWVWFEALAVSTYFLVAFHREPPASLEAAVKYLVQSAAGTSLVLLGIALVLMETGTLDLRAIARDGGAPTPALLAAGALFIVGFGVKAALVPLHSWLPDAHAQAPSAISAALSGAVIAAGLVTLLRAVTPLVGRSGLHVDAGLLFMSLGAINMLYGNLLALRQTSVKRLLAFSSLSHVGYMLLGVGITLYAGQAGGAQGGFFHMLNHGLMKGLAFLAAGSLVYALRSMPGPHAGLQIADLAGVSRRYPSAAFALSLAVLGLGGLPPLAGFMSKWQIFVDGFVTHDLIVELFVVFAAFNSVLSLAYYAPLVNALYNRESSAAVKHGRRIPAVMQLTMLLLSLAILAVGVWPALLQGLAGAAGTALLAAASP
jgi:proton-translocating NADH-quinone oxidoreductase chain N